jgi:hypothetical protein
MAEDKEPFVGSDDRPDVELKPDMPVSEMRVRDLSALLHRSVAIKKREFKESIKEFKHEKIEIKEWKEFKFEKYEKHEKFEKNEKIELEPIPKGFEPGPGPWPGPGPDPRIDQLIQTVSKLTSVMEDVTRRLDALEKRK